MSIPLRTRVALFFPTFIFLYSPLLVTGVLIALLYTSFYWVTLIYITFRVIDQQSPNRGGWSRHYLRGFFDVLKDHFPCDLEIVDKSKFDKNKNYILCVHPHGAIPFASLINFLSNTIKDVLELDSSLIVQPEFFWPPGEREILLCLGGSAASNDNMDYVLKKRKGFALAAIPGGIKEAALFASHSMEFRTSAVRGYAKLALQNGAQLVPVINFGETDIYDSTAPKSLSPLLRVLLFLVKLLVGADAPAFYGQGHLGMVPLRKPLTTVMGNPITSLQLTNPTFEDVQQLYIKYCQALHKLYYENREHFGYQDVILKMSNI